MLICGRSWHHRVLSVYVQVLELLLDKKAAEARHARETAARDAELTRLQDYIDQDLSELQQRQSQVLSCRTPENPAAPIAMLGRHLQFLRRC